MKSYYIEKIQELAEKIKQNKRLEDKDLNQQQEIQEELLSLKDSTENLLNIIKGLAKILDKIAFLSEEEEEIEKPIDDLIKDCAYLKEDLAELLPELTLFKKLADLEEAQVSTPQIQCPFCAFECSPEAYNCPKCHAFIPKLKSIGVPEQVTISTTDDQQMIIAKETGLSYLEKIIEEVKDGNADIKKLREKYPAIKKLLEENILQFDIEQMYHQTKSLILANEPEESETSLAMLNEITKPLLEIHKPLMNKCREDLGKALEVLELFLDDGELEDLEVVLEKVKEANLSFKEVLNTTEEAEQELELRKMKEKEEIVIN